MSPKYEALFEMDEQYYIGSSGLLVMPITAKGVTETKVYLAEDQVFCDYFNHHTYRGTAIGKEITVSAALHCLYPWWIHHSKLVNGHDDHHH